VSASHILNFSVILKLWEEVFMNSCGRLFRIQIFGESHGPEIAVGIDGCPAGIALNEADFSADLRRRCSGAPGTTLRREDDRPEIRSGVFNGRTSGAPILVAFANRDMQSSAYAEFISTPRPGQADWTARFKYGGCNDHRGGGHFSGRLTVGLVAAGVVAKKIISPTNVCARLLEAGGDNDIDLALERADAVNDSIGGIVACSAEPMPAGLGEPFFDALESAVARLIFAVPGIRGVEFGDGFAAARMLGSEHNDAIITPDGKTETNHCGGVNGGISNGNPLNLQVAVKPTSSIAKPQNTIDLDSGKRRELVIAGRHDRCFALRLPVVIEAAVAVVLADFALLQQTTIFKPRRGGSLTRPPLIRGKAKGKV
jgi:chorismate synthase